MENILLDQIFLKDTGDVYLNFLQNELDMLPVNIPPDVIDRHWFQHDGAPSHSTLLVILFMNIVFILHNYYCFRLDNI